MATFDTERAKKFAEAVVRCMEASPTETIAALIAVVSSQSAILHAYGESELTEEEMIRGSLVAMTSFMQVMDECAKKGDMCG